MHWCTTTKHNTKTICAFALWQQQKNIIFSHLFSYIFMVDDGSFFPGCFSHLILENSLLYFVSIFTNMFLSWMVLVCLFWIFVRIYFSYLFNWLCFVLYLHYKSRVVTVDLSTFQIFLLFRKLHPAKGRKKQRK